MIITPTETGRLVFEVQSTTKPHESRTVDMCANEGAGSCDCYFFKRQIQPALEAHIKASQHRPFAYEPDPRFFCEHIKAIRFYMSNQLVQTVRKQFPDHNQTT